MDSQSLELHPDTFEYPSFEYSDTDRSSARLLEKDNSDNSSIEVESDREKKAPIKSPKWLTVHLCTLLVYTVIFLSALIRLHLLDAKASEASHNPLDMIYCMFNLPFCSKFC